MGLREQILGGLSNNQGFIDAAGRVSDYVKTQPQAVYGADGAIMGTTGGTNTGTNTGKNFVDTGSKTPWEGGSFYDWFGGEIKKGYDEDMKRIADEESRLKRNELLTKIGDGLSAFHDAYAKAAGQQSMVDGTSLTGKWRERMDKLQKERAANRLAYGNAWMQMERNKATDRLNATREERLARQEQRMRESAQARNEAAVARARKDETQAKLLEAAADLVMNNGMTLQDARVYVGLEPKTTYTVANKIDNSGKSSTTVTTRTGDIPSANEAINNANTNTTTTTVTAGASGTKKSGTKKGGTAKTNGANGASGAAGTAGTTGAKKKKLP